MRVEKKLKITTSIGVVVVGEGHRFIGSFLVLYIVDSRERVFRYNSMCGIILFFFSSHSSKMLKLKLIL